MVSSYARGCVNDRTTSGAFRSNGSAKKMRTRMTSTTAPRLRNLRDFPYLGFFSHFFAAGIPPPEHTVHENPRLLPEFIHISVVFYHHIRATGLLLAGELAILYRAALFLPHSPLFCPRLATLMRRRDRNGNVELVAASALEEKRYFSHEEVRLGGSGTPVGLFTHARVQHLFEILQCFRVPEDLPA